MNKLSVNKIAESEISLSDIQKFIASYRWIIIISGVVGLLIAGSQMLVTQKKFQSQAIFSVAKIDAPQNNSLNFLAINVEEPSALIARLGLRGVYTSDVTYACHGVNEAGSVDGFTLSIPKNFTNAVAINAIGSSPEAVEKCAILVYKFIEQSQDQYMDPYIQDAKTRIAEIQSRLVTLKDYISNGDSIIQPATLYLIYRDEYKFLLNEESALRKSIASAKRRGTHLIVDINSEEIPLNPSWPIRLMAGIMIGICIGIFLSIFLKIINYLK